MSWPVGHPGTDQYNRPPMRTERSSTSPARLHFPTRTLVWLLIGLIALGVSGAAGLIWVRGPQKFTVILLPDTQYYVESYPDILTDQVDWILGQQKARNIVFVGHVGDIVEHYNNIFEWERADAILSRLIGAVPLGLLPGNHDLSPTGDSTSYNQHFGPERFEGFPWYGEGFPAGTNNNSYQTFSAGGYTLGPVSIGADGFLVLDLEFCPEADVIAWAKQVLEDHADRHAILVTHGYLDVFGRRNIGQPAFGCARAEGNTEYLFEEVVYPHPNVFLVLSGHQYDTQTMDGEARRADRNAAGRWVYQLVSDFQRRPEGGGGWLRVLGFNQELGQVIVRTYSPTLKQYEQDGDSDFWIPYPEPLR